MPTQGEDQTWAAEVAAETPPAPLTVTANPRSTPFVGGGSLLDIMSPKPIQPKIPCGECQRLERQLGYRDTEILALKAKIEALEQRIHEVSQVQEMRTSTAETIALRKTVAELQKRDDTQRRDLDLTYAWAWALSELGFQASPWGKEEDQ